MHREIFALGDSHSRRGFEDHAQIVDSRELAGHNTLDGKTPFTLERHEKKIMRISTPLQDKERIFCFGEVEVRWHITYKRHHWGIPTERVIEGTAQKYLLYVAKKRDTGYRIHTFKVVLTGDFSGEETEKRKKGLHYPFTATDEEQKKSYTGTTEELLTPHPATRRSFRLLIIS